jgi:hypothetical protein
MTIQPMWPDHLLDLDEWSALENSSRRFELAEGVLVVAPRPIRRQQKLIYRMASQLDDQAEGRFTVTPEFELVIDEVLRRPFVCRTSCSRRPTYRTRHHGSTPSRRSPS